MTPGDGVVFTPVWIEVRDVAGKGKVSEEAFGVDLAERPVVHQSLIENVGFERIE